MRHDAIQENVFNTFVNLTDAALITSEIFMFEKKQFAYFI